MAKVENLSQSSNGSLALVQRLQGVLPLNITGFHLLVTVVAGVLWGSTLHLTDVTKMDDYGLIKVLPITFYVAVIILILNITAMIFHQKVSELLYILNVGLYIIIMHGSPSILYGGSLRYSWAWKHVGVIDYIQRFGTVDLRIIKMPAYHNWPGFFSFNAALTELSGYHTALSYAHLWQVISNLSYLGALILVYRTFTADRRLAWLATWFFFLASWVGQDYFAPQATVFFMHLVVVGIILKWFKQPYKDSGYNIPQWIKNKLSYFRLTRFLLRILTSFELPTIRETQYPPRQRVGVMVVLIIVFYALISTHQLTPFMTIAGISGLIIINYSSARTIPILMGMMLTLWLGYAAVFFFGNSLAGLINEIGKVSDTVESNLIDLSTTAPGQRIVAIVGRILTGGMLGMAALGGLRRIINGYLDMSAIILAASPILIMAGGSYEGEMVFRVFLFMLPWAAFFAAGLIYPSLKSGKRWYTWTMSAGISTGLFVCFLFPYYGKEFMYYFTKDELTATDFIFNIAPERSLILEINNNYPKLYRNYEYFTYVSIELESPETKEELAKDPEGVIYKWLNNDSYAGAYLIITSSMIKEADLLGTSMKYIINDLREALLASPRFQVIFRNKDVIIFALSSERALQ